MNIVQGASPTKNLGKERCIKMAKATAHCTCKTCGTEFTKEKVCGNRTDADNWERWAENNIDTCPDCYKKEMAAKNITNLEKILKENGIELPVISGVSDKQIAYADSLRRRVILNQRDYIAPLLSCVNNPAETKQVAMENNITEDEVIKRILKYYHIEDLYVALYATDAHSIIDSLKDSFNSRFY